MKRNCPEKRVYHDTSSDATLVEDGNVTYAQLRKMKFYERIHIACSSELIGVARVCYT